MLGQFEAANWAGRIITTILDPVADTIATERVLAVAHDWISKDFVADGAEKLFKDSGWPHKDALERCFFFNFLFFIDWFLLVLLCTGSDLRLDVLLTGPWLSRLFIFHLCGLFLLLSTLLVSLGGIRRLIVVGGNINRPQQSLPYHNH